MMTWFKKYKYIVSIMLVGVLVLYWLVGAAPETETRLSNTVVPSVSFLNARVSNQAIPIISQGKAQAAEIRNISSEVSGLIVEMSKNAIEGGKVEKGETLMLLEQQPLLLDVALKQADLDQAIVNQLETNAKATIAKKGGKSRSSEFALYLPQLKLANSQVNAAEVALDYAELKLQRSKIIAPISGKVISVKAGLGEYINASQNLMLIYGDEYGLVRLPINDQELKLLNLNTVQESDKEGPPYRPVVYLSSGNKNPSWWQGHVVRIEGKRGRNQMIHAMVEFPLLSNKDASGRQEYLLPGTYVEARIMTPVLEQVSVLPRGLLLPNNGAWLVTGNTKLRKQNLEVLHKDKNFAYVSSGLKDQDKVVSSGNGNLVEGIAVTLKLNTEANLAAGASL